MFLLLAVALLGQTIPELKIRDHKCELTHSRSETRGVLRAEVKLWIDRVATDGETISLVFWFPCESKVRKKITHKNTPIFVMIGSRRGKELPLRFSKWVSGKTMRAARLKADDEEIGNAAWIYERSASETKNSESLVQAITWGEMLKLANANDVVGYAGDSHFTLSPNDVEGIRDLASRLGRDQTEVDAFFGESMEVPYNRLARLNDLFQECRLAGEKYANEGPDQYDDYAAALYNRVYFLAKKYGYPEDAAKVFEGSVLGEASWKKIQKNRS